MALSAAKKAIKGHPDYRFHRTHLPDGTVVLYRWTIGTFIMPVKRVVTGLNGCMTPMRGAASPITSLCKKVEIVFF